MTPSQLLRAARLEAELSQRALAERAALSKGVVERAEAHDRVDARALVRLLDACGQELVAVPHDLENAELTAVVGAHLRRSLATRLSLASGRAGLLSWTTPLYQELVGAARTCGGFPAAIAALDGPLAWAAWVPVEVLTPLHQQVVHVRQWRLSHFHRPRGLLTYDLLEDPTAGAVRVPLSVSGPDLAVHGPERLARTAPPAVARALLEAARLLHEQSGRDAAGRRQPAHRTPDVRWDIEQLRGRYGSGDQHAADVWSHRALRLDAPVSVRAGGAGTGLGAVRTQARLVALGLALTGPWPGLDLRDLTSTWPRAAGLPSTCPAWTRATAAAR